MSDKLKHQVGDVKKKGFGIIPKLVMQDTRLSAEAKAIYAYMASYAGAGDTAFPGVDLMMMHLGLSRARFYKHRKNLVELGYLTINSMRKDGKRDNNIYTLNQIIEEQQSQNLTVENETVEILTVENITANNNSSNNNSLNKNSTRTGGSSSDFQELAKIYQEVIGQPNGYTKDWIDNLLTSYGFEWSKEALLIAEKNGARKKSYVEAILEKWKANGGMKKASDRKEVPEAPKRAKESAWNKYRGAMA